MHFILDEYDQLFPFRLYFHNEMLISTTKLEREWEHIDGLTNKRQSF